jgi:hypothetical protein
MACHVYDLMYYKVLTIIITTCNLNTQKFNVSCGQNGTR